MYHVCKHNFNMSLMRLHRFIHSIQMIKVDIEQEGALTPDLSYRRCTMVSSNSNACSDIG